MPKANAPSQIFGALGLKKMMDKFRVETAIYRVSLTGELPDDQQ